MTLTVSIIATIGVVFLFLIRVNAKEKMILHIGVLISQEGELNLSGYIPAMNITLETIKNEPTFPFDFHVTVNDSMCNALSATRSFIDQVRINENQIMMIGSDCSVSTEPVAELAPYWNIVQISPSSVSPRLSDTKVFPRFLRTVAGEDQIVFALMKLMKQFEWSRIAVITQAENLFTFIATALKREFAASNLQLIEEYIFNTEDSPKEAVDSLKNSPARVIFVNMYSIHAAELLCQAYKNEMFHPTYAWIFFNWYRDKFWIADNPSCLMDKSAQPEDLERVLRTSLVMDQWPTVEDDEGDELNVGNITWRQYESEHDHKFNTLKDLGLLKGVNNNTDPALNESAFIFDALWTAALALNKTETQLNEMNLTLSDFTYDDKYNISDIIYEEALKVKFFGLTGNVSFLPNGDRPGEPRLLQYRAIENSLEKVRFARIIDGVLVYKSGESGSTIYPDQIVEDEEYINISVPLFAAYTIIAIFGIIFATICLVLNLWLREQKLVKLSSPYVNVMIVAGAVVFYVTAILFGVDENVASHLTADRLCHARIWLVAIGFSLLYGTIFAKTWRVYYIFNHSKPNAKFEVKDIYLFGIVGTLVAMDIVFLIAVTAVPGARLRREYEEIEGENANDLPQIIGVCTSQASFIWLPVLFAYKGFVLLVGMFLAFETRKVKIKSLNDSRFIAMSIYGAVIVSVTLTPIGFLLQNFPNVQYAIIGIMIIFSTSLILGLVFVTKWYKVYQDPKGIGSLTKTDDIDASAGNNQKVVVNGTDENYYKGRIMSLNEEIIDLNKMINSLNDELTMVKDGEVENTGVLIIKDNKMNTTV